MADEGQGGTITFGTSGTTIDARTIQTTGISRAVVNTTHLGSTTAKTSQPGDLYDPGTVEVTWLYDPDTQPPYNSAAETITVTYPLPASKSAAATEASSGYITNFDGPSLETDTEMIASMTIQRTGAITFTASTS